jgi:hypothetical protein
VRFNDTFEIHREEGRIVGRFGDRGLDVRERCVSPKRNACLVSQVDEIASPWGSGMSRAEAAQNAFRSELQGQRLCIDHEVVSQKDVRRVALWRDDDWAVVFELPLD